MCLTGKFILYSSLISYRWADIWVQLSAAFVLTGGGAEWRVGAKYSARVVGGGDGRRRWRQLIVAWEAVLAGEDITCLSEPRSQPASAFAASDILLVQQRCESLGNAVQRLVHLSNLTSLTADINKANHLLFSAKMSQSCNHSLLNRTRTKHCAQPGNISSTSTTFTFPGKLVPLSKWNGRYFIFFLICLCVCKHLRSELQLEGFFWFISKNESIKLLFVSCRGSSVCLPCLFVPVMPGPYVWTLNTYIKINISLIIPTCLDKHLINWKIIVFSSSSSRKV